jgi:hypothetical protein
MGEGTALSQSLEPNYQKFSVAEVIGVTSVLVVRFRHLLPVTATARQMSESFGIIRTTSNSMNLVALMKFDI